MRTVKPGRILHLSVWMAALIGLSPALTIAQQLDLPRQPSQTQSPVYNPQSAPTPIPRFPSNSKVRTLPQISPQSTNAAPSSAFGPPAAHPQETQAAPQVSQHQPALPAIFRGCWEGRVDYVDSLERLPGGARLGFWTPKTYRLCYRRIGNGPFVLTFTEAGIEQNDRITNAVGRMTLLSSDGQHYASMRSALDFDEYRTHRSNFGNDTFAVHEIADLNCTIEADGMHVNGIVTGWRNGTPWFRARWHAVFTHQPETTQQVEAPPGGIPE